MQISLFKLYKIKKFKITSNRNNLNSKSAIKIIDVWQCHLSLFIELSNLEEKLLNLLVISYVKSI